MVVSMPRKPYWLHLTRKDYAWEFRWRTNTLYHVNQPKPPRMRPIIKKGLGT